MFIDEGKKRGSENHAQEFTADESFVNLQVGNWSFFVDIRAVADIIANGIKIHYYRTRGDKPPVVLVHGITDNGLCWTRVARVLQHDYHVIMPDARGRGLSAAPKEGNLCWLVYLY